MTPNANQTTWATKSRDEILADINTLIDCVSAATSGKITANTVCMPTTAYRIMGEDWPLLDQNFWVDINGDKIPNPTQSHRRIRSRPWVSYGGIAKKHRRSKQRLLKYFGIPFSAPNYHPGAFVDGPNRAERRRPVVGKRSNLSWVDELFQSTLNTDGFLEVKPRCTKPGVMVYPEGTYSPESLKTLLNKDVIFGSSIGAGKTHALAVVQAEAKMAGVQQEFFSKPSFADGHPGVWVGGSPPGSKTNTWVLDMLKDGGWIE